MMATDLDAPMEPMTEEEAAILDKMLFDIEKAGRLKISPGFRCAV